MVERAWMDTRGVGDRESATKPFVPGQRGYYFPKAANYNLYWLRPQVRRTDAAGKALIENNQPTLAWICVRCVANPEWQARIGHLPPRTTTLEWPADRETDRGVA